ncbi:heterokaryon incompatibility protein [Apiospora phragmitis]|uniref:Heterokaryon incompatibility protein n=1 Tax=Apiospora phragmitis TaxID=2905665 RepID=A0ABR1T8W4_9PEZI
MRSIYSGAQTVRIFIGEAEDGDNMACAMDLLSSLDTGNSRSCFVERAKLDQDGSHGLINLLRRPYWQRMWMFQEIVLSRSAVVHCGPYKISWENLKELDKISGDPTIWFEAQLFALIGVCKGIPTHADYSRPIRDIYTDFPRRLLEIKDDISPLLTAGRWNLENGPQLNLPSRVSDYRGTHGVDIRYMAASHIRDFNASLNTRPSIAFPSESELDSPNEQPEEIMGQQYMLATRGLLTDTVSTITTPKKVQDSPQSLLRLTEPKEFGLALPAKKTMLKSYSAP